MFGVGWWPEIDNKAISVQLNLTGTELGKIVAVVADVMVWCTTLTLVQLC